MDLFENPSALITLNLTNKHLNSLSNITKYKNLIELDLSDNNFEKEISDLNFLKYLKRLNLSYNRIVKLWKFPENLEVLILNSNLISSIDFSIQNLNNLTILDLSFNLICDISSLKNLKNLKYLFLKNNHIVSIKNLSELKNLTELDLEKNEIFDLNEISYFENHENLLVLNLKENLILKNMGKSIGTFLINLPYFNDGLFSKNHKIIKNSMILINNTRKNSTNKSFIINKSLMQTKPEISSSISEIISSEEENEKNNKTQTENNVLNEFQANLQKIKEEKFPILKKKYNSNEIHIEQNSQNILSEENFTKNLNITSNNSSLLNTKFTFPNKLDDTNTSPLSLKLNFNKTLHKFKDFMQKYPANPKIIENNMKKISAKSEIKENFINKNNLSVEELIKKNHALHMENFKLKNLFENEKNNMRNNVRNLYEIFQNFFKIEKKNENKISLEGIIKIITEEELFKKIEIEKENFQKKIEQLTMKINDLESLINLKYNLANYKISKIKKLNKNHSKTSVRFNNTQINYTIFNEKHELESIPYRKLSNHLRARSLNDKNDENKEERKEKVKKSNCFNNDNNTSNKIMNKYIFDLKNTIDNLSNHLEGNQFKKIY